MKSIYLGILLLTLASACGSMESGSDSNEELLELERLDGQPLPTVVKYLVQNQRFSNGESLVKKLDETYSIRCGEICRIQKRN
jgi:hypothetical protein